MYRKILFFWVLSATITISSFAQEREAIIRIVQDDATFLDNFQTTVRLKKKQFKFQIALKNCDGVYVFASISDSVYRFTEYSPIQDFSYLKLLQLREEDIFNTNRELNISETGWSYWFYNPTAEWYPFNRKVTYIDTDKALCTKVIRQLYNVDERQTVRLKDLHTPLYLFFIAVAEYDSNGRPIRELLRRKLKIEWADED